MDLRLLELLACPKCLCELSCVASVWEDRALVLSGILECAGCKAKYPVESGIPRFVERENYAASFGYQWTQFKFVQLDSSNGTSLSEKRWHSETAWTKESLRGKWVLEVGCGAGRFLDIVSRCECDVVGVDISEAVDAAAATMRGKKNVHLVQASMYELPFRTGAFDACYCIGVIQHTPDPEEALRSLPRILKPGGQIAVTIYERKRRTLWNGKYLIRPVTKRLNKMALLFGIRSLMPILFPLTEVLFRIPYLGRLLRFIIPVANYVHVSGLSLRQRYEWAILDTFDMLAPQYDHPLTQEEGERALLSGGIVQLRRLHNPGLNLVGERKS